MKREVAASHVVLYCQLPKSGTTINLQVIILRAAPAGAARTVGNIGNFGAHKKIWLTQKTNFHELNFNAILGAKI